MIVSALAIDVHNIISICMHGPTLLSSYLIPFCFSQIVKSECGNNNTIQYCAEQQLFEINEIVFTEGDKILPFEETTQRGQGDQLAICLWLCTFLVTTLFAVTSTFIKRLGQGVSSLFHRVHSCIICQNHHYARCGVE